MDLHNKLTGCFTGKNIGGTLGMPYEGTETYNDLTWYRPIPEGASPNDDLDLQLVWLEAFKTHGVALDSLRLGEYWMKYIDCHMDEYGIALRNMNKGVMPPLSGKHDNYFTDGMGAAIRAEIWAALFPGKPLTAGYYAWQDSTVDHYGEGVYAEMFIAMLESDLYTSGNLRKSLDFAIAFLTDDSRLKIAFSDIRNLFASAVPVAETRDLIMKKYGSVNFTDVVMNLSFVVMALLYGGNDFSKTILLAVNCGQDTDCTTATAGAIMGILLGDEAIPVQWKEKVGDDFVVGDGIGCATPKSVSELVSAIEKLHDKMPGELPGIKLPFRLPELNDFAERVPWVVNGRRIEFPGGIKIDSALYPEVLGKKPHLKTIVSFDKSGTINLTVSTRGVFVCNWNGVRIGSKGDQMQPIPAPHRVRGGRVWPITVNAGEKYELEITMYSTCPIPEVYVIFSDLRTHRHVIPRYHV